MNNEDWEMLFTPESIFSSDVDARSIRDMYDKLGDLHTPHQNLIKDLILHLIRFVDLTDPNALSFNQEERPQYMHLLHQIHLDLIQLQEVSAMGNDKVSSMAVSYAKNCIQNQLEWILKDKPESPALVWYQEKDNPLQTVFKLEHH